MRGTSEGESSRPIGNAVEIHERVLTIDSHVDIPPGFATAQADPGARGVYQIDLPKMRAGGLDAAFFIAFVAQAPPSADAYAHAAAAATAQIDAIRRMTEMHSRVVGLASSPDELESIHASGRLAACIGVENAFAIGRDLSRLAGYQALGMRYVTLTHNGHNDVADSATPGEGEPDEIHGGLSAFGRDAIAEMNRLGIIVDISHTSKQSSLQAIAASRAPVIASHSSARAICDHPRNLDDETLIALQRSGGVAQVVAVDGFVKDWPLEKRDAIEAVRSELGVVGYNIAGVPESRRDEYESRRAAIDRQWPAGTVGDLVDHIDHMVKLIGIDHVGISSDFDGGGGIVGWNNAAETPNVTIELVKRGYTEDQIAKLWGGNLLRVWTAVEHEGQRSKFKSQR